MKLKSKALGIILLFLGSICIIYSVSAFIFKVNFAKFFSVVGLIFLLLGVILFFGKHVNLIQRHKRIFKVLKIAVILFIISFIVVETPIVYYGFKKDKERVDYIVVLGAGLWGETPSLALVERLEESINVIKESPETKIVVSGGMGPGETITEAEAMKKYLLNHGIEEERIIKEDNSRSTAENLEFTKKQISTVDNRKDIKILIVTNNFHMFRARLLAKHYGFKAYGSPAVLHPMLVPTYYLREYMAVIKTFIFDMSHGDVSRGTF